MALAGVGAGGNRHGWNDNPHSGILEPKGTATMTPRTIRTVMTGLCLAILLVSSSPAPAQTAASLPRSTPESQGVSSGGIVQFLDAADKSGVELHSFMVVRHGKVVSEGWWSPYGPSYKHVMFSASKTFTATGIGLAVAEGRLKTSDKVISFFPNSLPDTLGPHTRELDVKDLLTMSVGQEPAANVRGGDDWIRAFLATEPKHEPGTVFLYNNFATFMLSAIVQQVTGETLFDYLRPRLFEPLGIRGIDWDLTPQGINVGMIGLRLRTEDLAKFGQLLLQRGKWNGKQLLPESWVAEATSRHIASSGSGVDWGQGYGYQMWRGRHNSVRLDGLGGQFVLLLPDKDAFVVLTANAAQSTQKQLDLVWDHLLPAMKDVNSLPDDETSKRTLGERLTSLKVSAPAGAAATAALRSKIAGNRFQLDGNRLGIDSVTFKFDGDGPGELVVARPDSHASVKMGNGSWVVGNLNVNSLLRPSTPSKSRDANYLVPGTPYRVAASFAWSAPDTLAVTTRFLEESIGSETVLYKFSDDGGTVRLSIEEQRAGGFPGGPGGQTQAPLTGKMVASERP
jgi:CubicO group peptidase (beta-lactamase class C family)